MNIILATGMDDLNRNIRDRVFYEKDIEIKGECYYREALLNYDWGGDIVILSIHLVGETKMLELVKYLRFDFNKRIIYLPGRKDDPEAVTLVRRMVAWGVYDLVWDPITVEKIINYVKSPAAIGDTGVDPEDEEMKDLINVQQKEPEQEKRQDNVFQKLLKLKKEKEEQLTSIKKIKTEKNTHAPGKNTEAYVTKPLFIPPDFIGVGDIENMKCVSTTDELFEVDPTAIFIEASLEGLTEIIKKIKRKHILASIPVIVVGSADYTQCYAAGADECIRVLDEDAVERVKARAQKMRELWEQAVKDDLTGAYKRQFMEKFIDEQISRYYETGTPFSILMCDLDDFKFINDTYGHLDGDEVLKKFSIFVQDMIREVDVLARYGGEEFIVVFTNSEKAFMTGEKLRKEWQKRKIQMSDGQLITCTFSGGTAVMNDSIETREEIIKIADDALYKAKEKGKNRIEEGNKKSKEKNLDISKAPTVDSKETENTITKEFTVPEVKQPERTTYRKNTLGVRRPVNLKGVNVVAVGSPWVSSGSTTFAVNLAKNLRARGEKVGAVDCDIRKKTLGIKFGLSINDATYSDWRSSDIPVITRENITVFPLNPSSLDEKVHINRFRRLIEEASYGIDWLIVDVGTEPGSAGSELFLEAARYTNLLVWVVKDEPVLMKSTANWRARPKTRCKEVLVLAGEGSPKEIEESFILPCLQIKNLGNNRHYRQFINMLYRLDLENGVKALVAGFTEVPSMSGMVVDKMKTADEAREWALNNKPDLAVLYSGLYDVDLLEYELKKENIIVRKADDSRSLKSILGSFQVV